MTQAPVLTIVTIVTIVLVIIYLQEESGRILSQMAANHRDWLRAADRGKLMESGGPCCLASSGKMTSLVLNMAASFCGGNFLSESFAVAQHGDKNSSEKVRGGREQKGVLWNMWNGRNKDG